MPNMYDFAALKEAAYLYHKKYYKGAGGQAICTCGAASGGSSACKALSDLDTLFVDADFSNPYWIEEFEKYREAYIRGTS